MSMPREPRDPGHSSGLPSPPAGGLSSPHPWRSKNPLNSFRHAVEGVLHTFRTQRNMRTHFFTVACVLVSGLLFRLDRVEMLILLLTASLVLIAEMFNTAVEVVVDMITQRYHPAAKFAKDVAAGAVLIAALNAVVVGAVLFLTSGRPAELQARLQSPPGVYVFVVGFLLLLILLVVGKVLGAGPGGTQGTVLHGGVVSGHAAIAFFLATTVVFFAGNHFVSVLAMLLAFLVAQSRVETRIHTMREVVIGAALGLFLTASVYQLPVWLAGLLPRAATGVTLAAPR